MLMENIRLALTGLRANKMRAFLTMLGIIIGIAAVITIMTLGESLTNSFTTSMQNMGKVVTLLEEAGIRDQVKVIIGGAPVSTAFARKIGADGYSANATEAVTLVKELLA